MSRLPMWQTNWDQAEQAWNQQAQEAAQKRPLRGLKTLPQMPGITEETAQGLKWKSLKWILTILLYLIGSIFRAAIDPRIGIIFDPSKPTTWISYVDANNLYGWAMCQYLPIGGYK